MTTAPALDCSAEAECPCATSAPQSPPRCQRHPRYFLASCGGCQAAQAVRIAAIREGLGLPD